VTTVLFTWPSRGSVFAYGYDRESANVSRDSFEQLLDMLVRDPAVQEVDILAHSMGNFLVLKTLRQMAIRDRRIPAKIDDVIGDEQLPRRAAGWVVDGYYYNIGGDTRAQAATTTILQAGNPANRFWRGVNQKPHSFHKGKERVSRLWARLTRDRGDR
jgi:hypothetical protein